MKILSSSRSIQRNLERTRKRESCKEKAFEQTKICPECGGTGIALDLLLKPDKRPDPHEFPGLYG